ncbi:MAG: zinc metalloprotease HtpX [Chloroflexota bacterium]
MSTDNKLRTALLLTSLTVLFVLAGNALGGSGGMVIAFALALAMNFGAYWFSDRLALRMAGAKEVSPTEAPDLHQLVEQLALQARMPKPRLYLMDTPAPNAFATGRDPQHAAIAVTTGIGRVLDQNELAGVLAHELAHIKNRDTLISALAATVAGAITMLANMAQWALIFGGPGRSEEDEGAGGLAGVVSGLLMIVLAPIAAALIQMAISRTREFDADAAGARILGDPLPLARALEKLEVMSRAVPMRVDPSAAHQFTVQPFAGSRLASLFSTHPSTAARVARLREQALWPTSYQDWTQ